MKKLSKLFLLCAFLLSSGLEAQNLPAMPMGGPDNGTFDKSGRYPAGSVDTVDFCKNDGISCYSWVAQGQGYSGGAWRPAMWNFLQLADRAGISADSGTLTATKPGKVDVK